MAVALAAASVALGLIVVVGGANDTESVPSTRTTDDPVVTKRRDEPRAVVPSDRPGPIVRFTVGRGSRSAAVVRRSGASGPQPVVIFLHGWGLTEPSAYRRWIRHLAALGNTVIVPRYQRSARDDPSRVRARALSGIRRALARAPLKPGTLVVVGHSAGAALAADYAAVARSERLPRPVAVFAVYPGRRILGYPRGIPEADPGRIPASVRLTVLAGARDAVVGEAPARELIARATAIPRQRRQLIRVTNDAADHLAPTRDDAAARAAFWRRLDSLIDRARG